MQPINYMQGYQNPLDNLLGQVHAYQAISQNANTLRSQKAQSELEEAVSERKILAMQDLQTVDYNSEQALREHAMRYADLEYSKGVQAHLATLDEKQRQAEIGRVSQTLSLLKNGKNDVAIDDLLAQAQAYENAGDSQNAQGARQMAERIRQDPKSALDFLGQRFAIVVGKDGMSAYKDYVDSTAPKANFHDLGNQVMASLINPTTGEMTTQNVGFKGQSPDNLADNKRALAVAQGGWKNAQDVAHIQGGYNLQERQMQEAGDNARKQAELNLQAKIAEQEALIKANEVKPMEYGGKMWLVRADGKFKPMVGADGQQLSAGGVGGTGGGKSLTDTQSNAYTFGTRMLQSNDIVSRLEQQGVKMNWGQLQLDKDSWITTRTIVNAFSNPQQQQYAQAVDDFIHAVLRKESGAAIGADEYKGALRQYFPMPGDSPQVIAQKAQNRRTTIKGILGGVPSEHLLANNIDINNLYANQGGQGQQASQMSYNDIIKSSGAIQNTATTPSPQQKGGTNGVLQNVGGVLQATPLAPVGTVLKMAGGLLGGR